MVKCSKCGKVIEETMEGIFLGKCTPCFAKEMASGRLEVGDIKRAPVKVSL